eukprot:TCONS_00007398-protein
MSRHRSHHLSLTTNEQENLDDDFKQMIEDAKPYVLQLKSKEKDVIAAWIKKLCAGTIQSKTERKNRNLYAQIMVQILKNGKIKEPFTTAPTAGKLPTIPAYMSKYLCDDSELEIPEKTKTVQIPQWLEDDNLDDSIFSYSVLHESYQKYKDVLTPKKREKFMLPSFSSNNQHQQQQHHQNNDFDHQDVPHINISKESIEHTFLENLEMTSTTMTSPFEDVDQHKQRSAREEYLERYSGRFASATNKKNSEEKNNHKNVLAEKSSMMELLEPKYELKVKKLETKFQEENLKLQQEHDHVVKKILDRKNKEIDELKKYYSQKMNEVEDKMKTEKRKGESLFKENKDMKLLHAKESEQLRDAIERGTANTASEYEKLMYDKLADFEREMFDLQKNHRLNIRELLEEAEIKMDMMKNQHIEEVQVLRNTVEPLQQELQAYKENVDSLEADKIRNARLVDDLKNQLKTLRTDGVLQEQKYKDLETSKVELVKEYEKMLTEIRSKSEDSIVDMKKERENSIQKTTQMMRELECRITEYRQQIQEMEMQHKRESLEKNTDHQQELMEMKITNEKQLRTMDTDLEKRELEFQSKVSRYEYTIREKDSKIVKLETKLNEHTESSEKMIEEFRMKAEENSNQIFEELTGKLEKLQSSLKSAREKIDEQKIYFNDRHSRSKEDHEKEVEELKQSHEKEREEIKERWQHEKETLIESHTKEMQQHITGKDALFVTMETKYKEKVSSSKQLVTELQEQIKSLKAQVLEANTLRKAQLEEISSLRDEEKRNSVKSEDSLHTKYKSEIEKLKMALQSTHSEQMAVYSEKMNTRLKEIELEYTKKMNTDKNKISSLQSKLSNINKELNFKTNVMETKIVEISQKSKDEILSKQEKFHGELKRTQDDLETQQIKNKQLERKLKTAEMTHQEQISKLMLQSEEKMKGLLPITVQKDLQETIETMREQITILKSRAEILQEELKITSPR